MDPIPVLYIDEHLLAVNKPSGLLSIQDGYHPELPCLKNILAAAYDRIWVVHRLDKETSGVILFARDPETHRLLSVQFQNRSIHKTYHAFISGEPSWDTLFIQKPLKVNGDRQHRTVTDDRFGKPAGTEVRVLQRFDGYTMVAAQPHAGYTHQIRSHLASVGFPIVGDKLYHSLIDKSHALPAPRLMLHAWKIELLHPLTKKPFSCEAPYPPDFSMT